MARPRRPRKAHNSENIPNFPPFTSEIPYRANKSKFEVYGEEMIEKEVKQSGNSGRVYLPPDWIGKHVKIIRID